ncbi:MAG TPA: serine protease [Solirubrobacteraceae bacterium]|jgi:hypothetical protein|nr:serine protease [Solirubrobacteraceae bacterium]
MKSRSLLPFLLAVLIVTALGGAATASAASPTWAPESSATIHPGVMTFTNASSFLNGASQCTANFVFTDSAGNVYLGQAAHCSSTGEDTETDGCSTKSLPLGTSIYSGDVVNGGVQDGTLIGTLAYNSWLTMQKKHETDANTCAYNDLALIRIAPSQAAKVNPTVPFWGGPEGLASQVSAQGEQVFSYGNSILRLGISALSPKTGLSLGDREETEGWSQQLYTVTPGIPGDSGSGFMDSSGGALGVLSTVEFAPLPAANGVGTLAKELAYANAATGLGLQVARGTAPFNPLPVSVSG